MWRYFATLVCQFQVTFVIGFFLPPIFRLPAGDWQYWPFFICFIRKSFQSAFYSETNLGDIVAQIILRWYLCFWKLTFKQGKPHRWQMKVSGFFNVGSKLVASLFAMHGKANQFAGETISRCSESGKYQSQLKWAGISHQRCSQLLQSSLYQSGSEQIIGSFSDKTLNFAVWQNISIPTLLKKSNDIRRQVIWSRLNWFKTWLGEQRCWTSVEHIHVSWFYGLWGGAGWGCGGGGNMEADGTDTTRRSKSS